MSAKKLSVKANKSAAANPFARAHARIAGVCLALPDTTEEIKWDSPHFCVRGKIFASFGEQDGLPVITFKTDPLDQREKVRDPRYFIAAYVGRFGWVGMRLNGRVKWDDVKAGIARSYSLIAGGKKTARRPAQRTSATRPQPGPDSGRSRVRLKIIRS